MNYYSDSSEWKYLFKNAFDWDHIIPLYYPEFPTREGFTSKEELYNFFEELLTSTGDWAANSIAPRARLLDEVGAGTIENLTTVPSKPLMELYDEAKRLEIFGISSSPKYGGMGVPLTVAMMGMTQISRACMSSSTQLGFFTSIADMIERFCTEEDKERFIPKILKGEISGSMCLTEPGCGSDLGAIRTSAEKQEDGTYLLNGAKCFITNAGGGLAFILARIKGAPANLSGISMFFAEEWIEGTSGNKIHNYFIHKNEKKLGLHGSFTCEVVYENTRAKLVGQENSGMKLMFHLMNEARIGVGLQSLGGIEACLSYARNYAETRVQFGKSLLDLPLYKRNLNDWETERDAYRCLMADTISHFDIYSHLDLKKRSTTPLTPEEQTLFRKVSKIIRRRTPLVKYYGAEAFTALSTKAIQALGGYGFMHEYEAERFHRDSFAPLLYEGTSQIQALMALKDLIKYIMKNPSSFFFSTLGHSPLVNLSTAEKDSTQKQQNRIHYQFKTKLMGLLIKVLRPVQLDKLFDLKSWQNEKGMETLMTHAETICQALSYIETLRVLCKHAKQDASRKDLYERYFRLVNPRLKGIYCEWRQ